jgi:hypothetical protein
MHPMILSGRIVRDTTEMRVWNCRRIVAGAGDSVEQAESHRRQLETNSFIYLFARKKHIRAKTRSRFGHNYNSAFEGMKT